MNTTGSNYKLASLIGLAIILLSTLPCLAQPESHPQENIPKIVMNEVPLSAAIKNLARQANLNYILDPHVPSDSAAPPVTFTLSNISAKEALDRVLKLRGLVQIENSATTVTRIAPENLHVKPVSPESIKSDTNAVIPLIMFEDVPLQDALQNLARQCGLKITFDDKLMAPPTGHSISSTQVSARWTKLTARQALVALLDNYSLTMSEESPGSTARITLMKVTP